VEEVGGRCIEVRKRNIRKIKKVKKMEESRILGEIIW